MKTITNMMLGAAMMALVAGCGGESPSVDNQTTAMNEQSVDNSMGSDPSNPYGQAEMQMHERMIAAVGTDVSDTWVKKMIEHHRGAVVMSNIALQQGAAGAVREMAQMTITKQTKEIGELEAMAKQGSRSSEAGAAYGAGERQMHDAMMAAKGADASETWIRKMIEHHRGAIAMSEVVIARGQDAKVKERARKVAADQTREIGELERLLSGGAPPVPPSTNTSAPRKASREPTRQPQAAVKPKAATPKATPRATPTPAPAPDPHAGHDMSNMSR